MSQTQKHPSTQFTLRRFAAGATAFAMLGAVLATSSTARADEVSPKGKGIVGGALLGAEVVTIVESIAGVRKPWAYGVGGAVGAIGGGVAGYFVEQGSSDGRAPVYMLAGGLALVIPAVVLTLNATRYMPEDAAVEETTVTPGPAAEPGVPPGATPPNAPPAAPSVPNPQPPPAGGGTAPTTTPPPASTPSTGGGALLHMTVDPSKVGNQAAVSLGVPVPVVKQMWSVAEQKQYGLGQGTELRMPLVRVVF